MVLCYASIPKINGSHTARSIYMCCVSLRMLSDLRPLKLTGKCQHGTTLTFHVHHMLEPDHIGPCTGCEHAQRCRDLHLACQSFTVFSAGLVPMYLRQQLPRIPTRERYRQLFREPGDEPLRRVGPVRRRIAASNHDQGNHHDQM